MYKCEQHEPMACDLTRRYSTLHSGYRVRYLGTRYGRVRHRDEGEVSRTALPPAGEVFDLQPRPRQPLEAQAAT